MRLAINKQGIILIRSCVYIALMCVIGCAPAIKNDPIATSLENSGFAQRMFELIDTKETPCPPATITDRSTYWTCATYPKGHQSFVNAWEKAANSEEIKKDFVIRNTSEWLIFNNGELDYYSRSYKVSGADLLIAYDPSEVGREVLLANGSSLSRITIAPIGVLDTPLVPEPLPAKGTTPNLVDTPVADSNVPDDTEIFAKKALNLLGVKESLCDSYAIADKSIDWTCASYPGGHREFIKAWEQVSLSKDMKKSYSLKSTSEWMIFNDSDGIDFYGKSYTVSDTNVLIAYDPSEHGREVFIGKGSPIADIMLASSRALETSFLLESATSYVELPLVGGAAGSLSERDESLIKNTGSKNCSDFDNQRDAIAYFRKNGFSGNYDPYGLDADNNGIPCESFARQSPQKSITGSKCPAGKSWVSAYTRKDGRRVRGHCRARR